MINQLAEQIQRHWTNKTQSFKFPINQREFITIFFDSNKATAEITYFIMMKLTIGEFEARQELCLGNEAEITSLLKSEKFQHFLTLRYESLKESLEEELF